MTKAFENKEISDGQAIFREPRIRKLVKVELFTEQSGLQNSIVRNISTFGLRATSPEGLRVGQVIEIGKPGYGRVSGTVRWVDGGEFGMRFDSPIDVDRFNFEANNDKGHFLKKIDNGHVWKGFQTDTSNKRPGFRTR